MRRILTPSLLSTLLLLSSATSAEALIVADHPDDICAPAANPCVVADRVQVVAPGMLDFGLRTVHVTGDGRFERTAIVSCGKFTVDVGSTKVAADSSNGGGDAGTFSVTAQRACSGDAATPCLDDTVCVDAALGTCSVGDGTIEMLGQFQALGGPGGTVALRAAGDIHVDGFVYVNSTISGMEGGRVEIESFTGSVDIDASIKGNAGAAEEYDPEEAGQVEIDAAVDVRIGGPIELNGGSFGGYLGIRSGRDVRIEDDITSNGGGLLYASGGYVQITAARDILMIGGGSGTTRLQLNAGSRMEPYYGSAYPGSGGMVWFEAGGDIDIDAKSIIESRTPIGTCEATPYGGDIDLTAVGETRVDGDIFSAGRGVCGFGGWITLEGGDRVSIGETSELDTVARFGGRVYVKSSGTTEIAGKLNVRGSPPGYLYYLYGQSGYVNVLGPSDVTVSGQILAGSGEGGSSFPDIQINACRLRLEDGSKIDDTFGGAGGGGTNEFRIGESMYAAPGSEVLANPVIDGENRIQYRAPSKPPVLLGDMVPAAELTVNPSIAGCPVCGNLELDQGESCDDGNTASGDGCRNDCQDEGCLAASPGFPGTPLCDDGDACTLDVCDDSLHACSNVASCEEGIACTLDACVAGACQHTPDNAACDDSNECTVDSCSTTSGCVHSVQAGLACDDGDYCTQASNCQWNTGNCVASDLARMTGSRLQFKFGDVGGDDALKLRTRLPLANFTANPILTGLEIRLQDALDAVVLSASIPPGAFEDDGNGRYHFRDSDGAVAGALGIGAIGIRSISKRGYAKLTMKGGDMDLAAGEGQPTLTLSLLWGTDPAVDDCLTARRMTCTGNSQKLLCVDP